MSSLAPVGEYRVQVYLYDLSQGMARALSQQFLGKQIDGIWHTGVVVYGREYFYGGGIQSSLPGQSMAGRPQTVIDMGFTRMTPALFHEFLNQVSHRFTAETYSLLEHNCNNFSNEVSLFLTGKPIPSYITGLPAEALATPFGMMLRPMIAQMEGQMRGNMGSSGGGGGIGQPWASGALNLPRGIENVRPDRMVDPNSNPTVPHNMLESAAALAAQAINQGAGASSPAATPAAAAPASASASASAPVSVLKRSSPAKPLTSADKKAKSFLVLIKANSKKPGGSPLTPSDEATLTELAATLSGEGSSAVATVKQSAAELMDQFVQKWPGALQFPVLGVLRLMVLRPELSAFYTSHSSALTTRLFSFLPSDDASSPSASADSSERAPATGQAMALCTLANLFSLPPLAKELAPSAALWAAARACAQAENGTVRLMAATACYNAAVSGFLPPEDGDVTVEAATFLAERIGVEQSAEVVARLLLTLLEISAKNQSIQDLLVGLEFPSGGLKSAQEKHAASDPQVALSCEELKQLLAKAQQDAFKVE